MHPKSSTSLGYVKWNVYTFSSESFWFYQPSKLNLKIGWVIKETIKSPWGEMRDGSSMSLIAKCLHDCKIRNVNESKYRLRKEGVMTFISVW